MGRKVWLMKSARERVDEPPDMFSEAGVMRE